jgi:serine/threonine-protein kinase
VFSIGTLLWELTTRRRLFVADNELALLSLVARGEITRPSEVQPDYPPALEAIVMKALAADREQRYADAQQLQLALEDFAHEARLPMSAARLQPLLHEVCGGRLARVEALLAAQHDTPPADSSSSSEDSPYDRPEEQTAVFGASGLPSGTPGPAQSLPEATEPGRSSGPDPATTVDTDVSMTPVPPRRPSRSRLGVVLGLAAGLGIAAGAWALVSSSSPSPATTPPASPDRAEAVISPTPVVSPSDAPPPPEPEPAPTPEPESEPELAPEPEPEPIDPSPVEPPVDETETPTSAPSKSTSRTKRRKSGGGHRSTPRPSSGKSTEPAAAPSKEPKPKWDPKAAPPPGL